MNKNQSFGFQCILRLNQINIRTSETLVILLLVDLPLTWTSPLNPLDLGFSPKIKKAFEFDPHDFVHGNYLTIQISKYLRKLTLIAKFILTNIWSISRLKLAISFRPSKVGSIINFALPVFDIKIWVLIYNTFCSNLVKIISLPGLIWGIENTSCVFSISWREIIPIM